MVSNELLPPSTPCMCSIAVKSVVLVSFRVTYANSVKDKENFKHLNSLPLLPTFGDTRFGDTRVLHSKDHSSNFFVALFQHIFYSLVNGRIYCNILNEGVQVH